MAGYQSSTCARLSNLIGRKGNSVVLWVSWSCYHFSIGAQVIFTIIKRKKNHTHINFKQPLLKTTTHVFLPDEYVYITGWLLSSAQLPRTRAIKFMAWNRAQKTVFVPWHKRWVVGCTAVLQKKDFYFLRTNDFSQQPWTTQLQSVVSFASGRGQFGLEIKRWY